MKHKCKSIPVARLIATHTGFLKPLCDDCKTFDCENDIEKKKISVLGIIIETKLLVKKDESHFVISCEGYLKDDK